MNMAINCIIVCIEIYIQMDQKRLLNILISLFNNALDKILIHILLESLFIIIWYKDLNNIIAKTGSNLILW